jgi:hypothetical protein
MVDLPAPERPVNHSTRGFWPFMARAPSLSTSSACQWMFCAAAQGEVQHARAHRAVGDPVDEDEAAEVAVLRIGIEGDRRSRLRLQTPISLSSRRLAASVLQGVHVDLVLGLGDLGRDRAGRASAGRAGPAAAARRRIQTVASNWSATSGGLPAAASTSPRETSISSASASASPTGRRRPRRRSPSLVTMRATVLRGPAGHGTASPGRTRPARRAGEAAEVEVRPVHPLHRQAERRFARGRPRLGRLQPAHQRRAGYQGAIGGDSAR